MAVFTIRGRKFNIDKNDVVNLVKDIEPDLFIGNRKYYVEINGVKYPIKQIIALITGLPRSQFTALDAYRILTKLGFEVKELHTSDKSYTNHTHRNSLGSNTNIVKDAYYPNIIASIENCFKNYCSNIEFLFINCREAKSKLSHNLKGLYVFIDPKNKIVYYVGQASDLKRRIAGEHCRASIGGSEGVVRFLMFLIDRICSNYEILSTKNVIKRERLVKEIIKKFLNELMIVVAVCHKDVQRIQLLEAEKCVKKTLNPILNPL